MTDMQSSVGRSETATNSIGLFNWWITRPEGWFLQKLLFGMVVACFTGMVLDASGYFAPKNLPIDQTPKVLKPVDIPRPKPGDNLRPFQPRMVPRPSPDRLAEPRLPDGTPIEFTVPGRMKFSFKRNADGVPLVVAIGDIATGTAEEFKRFDEAHKLEARYVFLLSHGGRVGEALAMAQYIRKRALKTVVPHEGVCFSACPLVLAGGVARVVYPDSWVGLHQAFLVGDEKPSVDDAFNFGQKSVADIMVFLEELGVDPMIWRHAIKTPPDQIYMLSKEELIEARMATVFSPNIKLK